MQGDKREETQPRLCDSNITIFETSSLSESPPDLVMNSNITVFTVFTVFPLKHGGISRQGSSRSFHSLPFTALEHVGVPIHDHP